MADTAYATVWRVESELLTGQWRHIDLKAGWLRLDPGESKNAEGREFPFTAKLRAILQEQRERFRAIERLTGQIVPWVFVHPDGSRIRDFRYAWAKAKTEAVYRRYAIVDSGMLQEAATKLDQLENSPRKAQDSPWLAER